MGGVCIGLESDRAGARTLEKTSRRDRDRVLAKFEMSLRFRASNMNQKKKARRARGLGSDSGLDLAISRFTNRYNYTGTKQPGKREKEVNKCRCFPFTCHCRRYRIANTVLWIRIRIDFGRLDTDPHLSRRAKMTHKNR